MMESRLTAMILEFLLELVELKHAYHHCGNGQQFSIKSINRQLNLQ